MDSNGIIVKPKGVGVRHYQICWIFGAMVFGYLLRVNMSVAVMGMVAPSKNPNIEYYNWDSATRSLLLSSFFWGYVIAQLPAGLAAQRYGPKIILTTSTALCSILTIVIPWATSLGDWKATCALRVLIGFCQGTVYPCVHTLLAKWVPKTERGFLVTFVFSGAQVGTVLMLGVSGTISGSYIGWPSLFYLSGGLALAWSAAYMVFGSNAPVDSKSISDCEREYIENLSGSTVNKTMKVPWKDMFTSKPFIALIFAHCGYTWGFYTLLTEMPTYMNTVLNQSLDSGLLAALPYFAMWILSLIISPIADRCINKGCTSVETSRKIFNSIGQWIPMVSLIALGYMTKENVAWAVFLLTVAVGFNSASYVGYMVNHIDLAPNFAGTMMGITNGLSNFLSIFAPLVVGGLVTNESDPIEWRSVFFITAGFYLVCNLVFIIFGKAEIQPWNSNEISVSSTCIVDTSKPDKCA